MLGNRQTTIGAIFVANINDPIGKRVCWGTRLSAAGSTWSARWGREAAAAAAIDVANGNRRTFASDQ